MIRDVNRKPATRLISWLRKKLDPEKPQVGPNEQIQRNIELKEQRRQLEEQLEEQVQKTVGQLNASDALAALGRSLNLKDAGTEAHCKRVTAFAAAIAREMNLLEERIRVIAYGAFLHDIGKMAIADVILKKPGPLDPAEFAFMREHCHRGYRIVNKGIPSLPEAAEIAYAHHENFDGTGYPRGLRGNGIPIGARIVAVANTLDAMTSDRPYRVAGTLSEAVDEIQRCAGSQLDPEIVRPFLNIPSDIWLELRRDSETLSSF